MKRVRGRNHRAVWERECEWERDNQATWRVRNTYIGWREKERIPNREKERASKREEERERKRKRWEKREKTSKREKKNK